MIISAWWLRISSKFSGKKSKKQRKTQKWTTPKQVQIRLKYSTTITFLRQEGKDGTNKTVTTEGVLKTMRAVNLTVLHRLL